MVTSLDHFVNKTVIKNIFNKKWSRLVGNSVFGPVFEWLKQDSDHLIIGPKKCPENDHSQTRQSGIRSFTVHRINFGGHFISNGLD